MKLKFIASVVAFFLSSALYAASIHCVSYGSYGKCQGWVADGKFYQTYPGHLNNQNQSKPQTPARQVIPKESKFEIPVIVIVSTAKTGKGNEKWRDKKYVEAMLARSSEIGANVSFKLKSLATITSKGFIKVDGDKIYNSSSQEPALNYATSKATSGHIVIVISGEKTTRSSGLAWVGYRAKPVFAMRSRFNGSDAYSAKAIDNTAGIFVHELGHNMGLGHSANKEGVHTDNYTKKENGLLMSGKYFKSLSKKSCKKISSKGLCIN